jgi:septal ring factor EnvC (AmiA/AmiB activator)
MLNTLPTFQNFHHKNTVNILYYFATSYFIEFLIIFREMQAASDKKRDLRDRLRICQRDLCAANLQKEKLNEELYLKSNLNKQLEDDMQHLEHEKRRLQKKVHDLENAISSPSGKNPRDSALRRLILESPIPEAIKVPRLTNPAEADTSTSALVRRGTIGKTM